MNTSTTAGRSQPPVVLTIGGSDSGGCYGVQADLRAFAAHGTHATCALTVVTAQNTTGLRAATPLSLDAIVDQIAAVTSDFQVAATKTGMLGRVEVIEAVAQLARDGVLGKLVVDPVLVGNRDNVLFPPAVAAAYRDVLLPLALVTTPNEPEARLLVGETTVDRRHTDGAVRARLATAIGDGAGGIAVVVTGGRSEHPGNGGTGNAVDVYYPGSGRPTQLIVGEWTDTANNAGTGDAFSASITAALARGLALDEAVVRAAAFVRAALTGGASWRLGAGPGPIDHLGWSAVPER